MSHAKLSSLSGHHEVLAALCDLHVWSVMTTMDRLTAVDSTKAASGGLKTA